MAGIEVIPSAKRLINSLRDMGYDFSQAVADIVDNSVEAGATVVSIQVEFDGDDSWISVADNGKGMKPEQLREAMRYGAERDYDMDDLGKFGLGLKTASMSQCQRLSVASRWNRNRADIAAYSWDLSHVERTNRWEILELGKHGLGAEIRQPLKHSTGTVVLWQRLDRILGYKHPYSEPARRRLAQMCREIELHLAMVFHRFMTREARGKKLKLLLNGNEIKPWDPFCRGERKTKVLNSVRIILQHEGVSGEVLLEPFVLPHQDDFSSPEAFRWASGPANWNQQQGFYIYRAGRMIQSGGWSGLRTPDEHTKLARIAISFSPKLDDAFKVNVAKMRVQLPSQIRDEIRDAIGPVVKLAREVYDRRAPKSSTTGIQAGATNSSTGSRSGSGISKKTALMTFTQWSQRVLKAARRGERPVVKAVLSRFERRYH